MSIGMGSCYPSSSISICAISAVPAFNLTARACPIATAPTQRTTEATTLISARMSDPCRIRSSVWRLKDENVVKPTQNPTMITSLAVSGSGWRPWLSVSVPKKPITNDPDTLISIVPQGFQRTSPRGRIEPPTVHRTQVGWRNCTRSALPPTSRQRSRPAPDFFSSEGALCRGRCAERFVSAID
jgi:hypothetical protein